MKDFQASWLQQKHYNLMLCLLSSELGQKKKEQDLKLPRNHCEGIIRSSWKLAHSIHDYLQLSMH